MATTGARLGEAATAATESVGAATQYMGRATERLREDFSGTEERVRAVIDEYPLTCFFGAVVAGYLLGRIATRM